MTTFFTLPKISSKLGLGVGMNLPWGQEIGFQVKHEGDGISDKMYKFFEQYSSDFSYIFIAFQPKNLNKLDPTEYHQAYDCLFEAAAKSIKAFHHTMLNMGTMEQYEKEEIARFTNSLIKRYNFEWIVEDLGIWSVKGKPLPYPLPPILNDEGLRRSIKNVREWQQLLEAPLSIEFPGFTEGSNFYLGHMHAFDFFRLVANETQAIVTIDVGHILSYQWIKGNTNGKLLFNLDKLPLDRCFELHLSGSVIKDGKFRDMHHGVLLDEQIELLDYFLSNCPNLKAITYEDPRYDRSGKLIFKASHNYTRLKEKSQKWLI